MNHRTQKLDLYLNKTEGTAMIIVNNDIMMVAPLSEQIRNEYLVTGNQLTAYLQNAFPTLTNAHYRITIYQVGQTSADNLMLNADRPSWGFYVKE